jgi:hypothetical protein
MASPATRAKFVYGSKWMNDNLNYNTEDMEYNDRDYADYNGHISCNNDCYNCMLDCPYKKY